MNKFLAGFLSTLGGYIGRQVVKYITLLSGPFILGPVFGLSGPRVAADLEAAAEILGFIIFIIVIRTLYKRLTNNNKKHK